MWGYFLAFFSLSVVLEVLSSSFMNTQKDNGSYNSVNVPLSLAGKVARKTMVSSLLRAGF